MRFSISNIGWASVFALALSVFASERNSLSFSPSSGYKTFQLNTTGNVTRVLISNPPINLLDGNMIRDFDRLLTSLQTSPGQNSKVYIFSSADPTFFINHLDLHYVSTRNPPAPPFTPYDINTYINVTKKFATVPAILIGEISGKTISGGDEISVQLDMRFASTGAELSAPEVSLGVLHAIGGLQYLVRLIGPGRAAEYLLSATGANAKRMAEIGWVNQAFGTRKAMEAYVDALAARIGLFPQGGLNATKQGIRNGFGPRPGTVDEDIKTFNDLSQTPQTQSLVDRFLILGRNETKSEFELGLPGSVMQLYM
ncbi:hypothetical protein FH972_022868 [Carpinus fangiana]|uniref:Enoyl-CoA hydratase n=1 Tax=Carpinus fangiana TaxID=176857 RepID=A0A5N6KU15_9ROSI|nr:hypothetical protein FH972_022868 [Carpinus fangiana]